MEGRPPTATFPDDDYDNDPEVQQQSQDADAQTKGQPFGLMRLKGGAGGKNNNNYRAQLYATDEQVNKDGARGEGITGFFEDLKRDVVKLDDSVKCGCCCALVLLIVLIFAILLFGSWHYLNIPDIVLARSAIDPVLIPKTIPGPGIQTWPNLPPFAELVVWPQREQEIIFEPGAYGVIRCNSKDGLQIVLDVSFQYKILADKLYNLTLKYKDFTTYTQMLISIARANIQHSCADYTAEDVQRARNSFAETISVSIKADLLNKLDAMVSQTQLRNTDRPDEYDDAVRDKENALNTIRLALAERSQALTKAQTQYEQRIFEGIREIDTAQRDAAVEILRAEAEAAAIVDNYNALVDVYSKVKEKHNLTVSGVLTYISNEIFSGDGIETKLAFQSPSKVSYQDEL